MSNQTSKKLNSPNYKFNIGKFKITEEEFDLRLRSNSCAIPSLEEFVYHLDFVPKLK
jgi:hypothetical protein